VTTAEAPAGAVAWLDANQRHLSDAVAAVRRILERHIADGGRGSGGAEPARPDAETERATPGSPSLQPPPALEAVCTRFGLSSFERLVLVLCAGVELDGSFAGLCAAGQPDGRPYPTFGLALAALPEPHWSAVTPGGPLRRWRLVQVGGGEGLTADRLRIDERVLHYLAGVDQVDPHLRAIARQVEAGSEIVPSHRVQAERIVRTWSSADSGAPLPVVVLSAQEAREASAVAGAACGSLGMVLWAAPTLLLPSDPIELDAFLRLWEREAALSGSALLLECDQSDAGDAVRTSVVSRVADSMAAPLIVFGPFPMKSVRRPTLSIEVGRPTGAENRALWERAIGSRSAELDALVSQFTLCADAVRSAAAEALSREDAAGDGLGPALWEAARAHARPPLDDLAQRIRPVARWDDLVLPPAQSETLRLIATHVRERTTVYDSWGFATKGARGLGISALFAGSSGTGKTMAAEVLANELRLDLYRIDLSSVVSKYIGETEKNLRRVFDAAETGAAMLLFDEADALFGKRTEVKDSHDRYANIEVSYLLQRMEAYRGLAILTTNMKGSLDPAFLRRIHFMVQFPFPDAEQRAEIWRRVFPAQTPVDGIDPDRLARLIVPGGSIRNIALGAAFLAADERAPVRMAHIFRAARAEYAKLEKKVTEMDIGGTA
jgi:hypothetical protein